MSTAPHIDPRLQYSHQPPAYQQSLDHARRPQHTSQPQSLPHPQHLPPSSANSHGLVQRPQHDLNSSPQQPQPYYLPQTQVRSAPPPQHVGQTYDPVFDQQDSPGGDSDENASPLADGTLASDSKAIDPKRARACDSCRGLKVKCDFPETGGPGDPCKRCAKARRACIVTPATRRRQKKADGRVAELERKVDALTARLLDKNAGQDVDTAFIGSAGKRSASPFTTSPASRHHDPALTSNKFSPDKRRRLSRIDSSAHPADRLREGNPQSSASDPPSANGNFGMYNQAQPKIFDHTDVDRKISQLIGEMEAEYLFDRYVSSISHIFPAVVFPPGARAVDVRRNKPILFLAILSSTCYGTTIRTEIQEALEELLREVLADSMWKKGEKSLEIIQSLQVATLWYRPPHNFEQHMFYQMVHMSAVMAVDIGIGKKIAPARRRFFEAMPTGPRPPNATHPESAEVRRAWLTSYFLCTSISMILRRAIMVRYNDYMKDCIDYLENDKAEDVLPSDKILCQHVRIAHISEDVTARFAMDDPTVNLSIADSKVTYGIKHFEEDLGNVLKHGPSDLALKLSEHVTNLYLHEIALHSQHNVEEFKTPFMDQTFKGGAESAVLGPHHVDALTACQHACRSLLDTFIASDVDTLYTLPILFSVRCIYSVVVLIKLYMAAKAPGEMSQIIKPEDLHVTMYISRLRQIFEEFVKRDESCPHKKFYSVMKRLSGRFSEIERGEVAANMEGAQAAAALAQAAAKGIGGPMGEAFADAMSSPAIGRSRGNSAQTSRKANAGHPQPAQGLHLLSEVAMGGNAVQNTAMGRPPTASGQPHQHPQQPGWYPQPGAHPQGGDMTGMAAAGMSVGDPNAAAAYAAGYPNMPITGFENFDYGLGSLGLGVDGAISGLFMADGLWNYDGAYGAMHPGWS